MSLPTLKSLTDISTWNRHYREMQDLLSQGPEARKLVVDALTIIATSKDLSYGERKMLDQAKNWEQYMVELQRAVQNVDNVRKKFDVEHRRAKFHIV